MKFLHSMLRVSDPDATVAFFRLLGLEERRRRQVPEGKFTLIFLGVPGDDAEVELTHNWERQATTAAVISATSLSRSTIFMRLASGWPTME
jgi:catechol 2,3-dioxygenase-like lactoylglutathione lyase family enzyme